MKRILRTKMMMILRCGVADGGFIILIALQPIRIMRTLSLVTRPLAFFCTSRLYFSSSFLYPLRARRSHLAAGLIAATALKEIGGSRYSTTTSLCSCSSAEMETGYLNATAAAELDAELMTEPGFSLEQLMELAGLSVAEAVYQLVEEKHPKQERLLAAPKPHILLVCGPGNNGGDGLVAARHLFHFGYDCTLIYPKRSKKQHFVNLQQQCTDLGITIRDDLPEDFQSGNYVALVDAIFGFSFHGEPREPFATILQQFSQLPKSTMVIAVDVPSGWHVDDGDVAGTGFLPAALISLTAPKNCARKFSGRHFVGGRFLPPVLAEKYNVRMPAYPGTRQVVEIKTDQGWEADYAAYLAEKEAMLAEEDRKKKPSEGDESWEAQYAAYLAEKETKEFAEYAKRKEENSV